MVCVTVEAGVSVCEVVYESGLDGVRLFCEW